MEKGGERESMVAHSFSPSVGKMETGDILDFPRKLQVTSETLPHNTRWAVPDERPLRLTSDLCTHINRNLHPHPYLHPLPSPTGGCSGQISPRRGPLDQSIFCAGRGTVGAKALCAGRPEEHPELQRTVVTWTGLGCLTWAQLTAPLFITETHISEREKAG